MIGYSAQYDLYVEGLLLLEDLDREVLNMVLQAVNEAIFTQKSELALSATDQYLVLH